MNKKEEKKAKIDLKYIIIGVVALLIILVVSFVLFKGCSKEENKENNNEVEKIGAKEEDIIKAYGMSKEEAIELVQKIYKSDNYEFSVEINKDSKYVVSVKNLINEKVSKFLVDPTTVEKSFYQIDE